jgi:hypothetical protein
VLPQKRFAIRSGWDEPHSLMGAHQGGTRNLVWCESRTHPGTPCVTPKLGATQGGLPHGGDEPPSVGLPQGQRGIQVLGFLKVKEEFKCWIASMPRGSQVLGCLNTKGNPIVGCFFYKSDLPQSKALSFEGGSLMQLGCKT